jgi:hypothetical protein
LHNLWDTFQNVVVETAQQVGIVFNTSAVVNFITFRDTRVALSQQWGIYFNNSNANPSLAIDFDHVNVEYNGAQTSLANCAGLYLTGVGEGSIRGNSYFEGNCLSNSFSNAADIRLTGTYVQAFSVLNTLMQASPNGIYNDATLSTGVYEGNYFNPVGFQSITVNTTNAASHITIGNNYNLGTNNIVTPSKVFIRAEQDTGGDTLTGSGIFINPLTMTISALSTATVIPGSGANSGILHVRDNTLGGSAVFIIDPNAGVQLLGSSGVTGLAAAGVTFSSGVWHLSLSSGSTPRTLNWAILQ